VLNDIKYYSAKVPGLGWALDPGLWAIINYRFGHFLLRTSYRYRYFNPLWYVYLIFQLFVTIIFKIELPPNIKIGKNLFLAHPHGLVTGGKCQIGNNVTIGPWVVLGHNFDQGGPIIEDECYIAAKATILGAITIGHNSTIGAGVVVSKDVPPNSIVRSNFNKS